MQTRTPYVSKNGLRFRAGDVLLRGSIACGFELVDPLTREVLGVRIRSIGDAVDEARRRRDGDLWHVHTDARGRAVSQPIKLGTLTPESTRL